MSHVSYIYIYGSSLLQCMNPTWQWGPQIEREDTYIRCMRDVLHRERERERERESYIPHEPWFLTGVTAPFFLQSTDLGKSTTSL